MQQTSEEKIKSEEQDKISAINESYVNHEECSEEEVAEIEEDLSLEDQITALELKVTELKDLYVRSQAEIQNVQRRSIEEVKKARDYAFSSFAKDVVIVKDYLEMAMADTSGNVETMKTGVDLTLKQIVQIFERNSIKDVNPEKGDKLDPNLHQAMNSVESEGQESNSVVSVMQKGYILNGRVLRPAMVVVAK
jgi:molecular chaperone GrpE